MARAHGHVLRDRRRVLALPRQRSGTTAHEVVVELRAVAGGVGARARLRVNAEALRRRSLLAQVAEFEPDVVYVQNLHSSADETMRALKPARRALVGQIATRAAGSSGCECST